MTADKINFRLEHAVEEFVFVSYRTLISFVIGGGVRKFCQVQRSFLPFLSIATFFVRRARLSMVADHQKRDEYFERCPSADE